MTSVPRRVAICGASFRGGGAELIMVMLARGIAQRGYDVDLLVAQREGPHLANVPACVRVVDLKASRLLASLPALTGYLRRQRPEALLSVMKQVNIVALWAKRLANVPTRVIVSEHNTLSVATRGSRRMRSRAIPWLIRRFYPWADGIVAVSRGVAEDLAEATGLPRSRIHVIYNPIVRPELLRLAETPVHHPWFDASQPPVIVAMGRLTAQKDFPTLLRAFHRVRHQRPCRLLIFGEGPDRPGLEALRKELGLEDDVVFAGYNQNPYAYIRRATAFVLSSRWEGLPTVLVEAMVCGVPVISTDCPSGPREILEDGRHGRLVPVGDVTALAEAITGALSGNIVRPSRESWQAFELEQNINKYLDVLFGNSACALSVTGCHSA